MNRNFKMSYCAAGYLAGLVCLAAGVIAQPVPGARAQTMDTRLMAKADALGTVIGSAEACGFEIDDEGVEMWIEKNVPADVMGFPGFLGSMVRGQKFLFRDKGPSAMRAHCAAVRRTGEHHGLLR